MSTLNKIDCHQLLSLEYYGKHGYPHETWDRIRQEDPVHWVSDWYRPPYWALTRHEDIVTVSKNPAVFENEPPLLSM